MKMKEASEKLSYNSTAFKKLLCGRGSGGMIWENGTETCIVSYKKRIASPGLMQDTGSLELVHWDYPEGWYEEGGGSGV